MYEKIMKVYVRPQGGGGRARGQGECVKPPSPHTVKDNLDIKDSIDKHSKPHENPLQIDVILQKNNAEIDRISTIE